jgi:hypothetical protein
MKKAQRRLLIRERAVEGKGSRERAVRSWLPVLAVRGSRTTRQGLTTKANTRVAWRTEGDRHDRALHHYSNGRHTRHCNGRAGTGTMKSMSGATPGHHNTNTTDVDRSRDLRSCKHFPYRK